MESLSDVVEPERLNYLQDRINALPRVSLAHLPTPLSRCDRIGKELGIRLAIKRDDCTGLAFGGNKVRQHEFVLGDALAAGADCIIQGSASQSNHSRQLAAAGARLGIDVFLLPKNDPRSSPLQGNYLVDHLLGAHITPIPPSASTADAKEALAEALRAEGRSPYVVGMGAKRALALSAVAYVEALIEIVSQAPEDIPGTIVTTSQGSTQAGLQLGCELLGLSTKVIGINPMTDTHEAYLRPREIADLAVEAASILGLSTRISEADIVNDTSFAEPAYGHASSRSTEAILRLASAEGILLDPVYSGKGFAGLIHYADTGYLDRQLSTVFVHTGGLPALFSHASELENLGIGQALEGAGPRV